MQTGIEMNAAAKRKASAVQGVSKSETPSSVEHTVKDSRLLSAVRAVLDEKEREQLTNLIEREKWIKRLAF